MQNITAKSIIYDTLDWLVLETEFLWSDWDIQHDRDDISDDEADKLIVKYPFINIQVMWFKDVLDSKKKLFRGTKLFSECKRQHYIYYGVAGDRILLAECDRNWKAQWAIQSRKLSEMAWEFLHAGDRDVVYNLIETTANNNIKLNFIP